MHTLENDAFVQLRGEPPMSFLSKKAFLMLMGFLWFHLPDFAVSSHKTEEFCDIPISSTPQPMARTLPSLNRLSNPRTSPEIGALCLRHYAYTISSPKKGGLASQTVSLLENPEPMLPLTRCESFFVERALTDYKINWYNLDSQGDALESHSHRLLFLKDHIQKGYWRAMSLLSGRMNTLHERASHRQSFHLLWRYFDAVGNTYTTSLHSALSTQPTAPFFNTQPLDDFLFLPPVFFKGATPLPQLLPQDYELAKSALFSSKGINWDFFFMEHGNNSARAPLLINYLNIQLSFLSHTLTHHHQRLMNNLINHDDCADKNNCAPYMLIPYAFYDTSQSPFERRLLPDHQLIPMAKRLMSAFKEVHTHVETTRLEWQNLYESSLEKKMPKPML